MSEKNSRLWHCVPPNESCPPLPAGRNESCPPHPAGRDDSSPPLPAAHNESAPSLAAARRKYDQPSGELPPGESQLRRRLSRRPPSAHLVRLASRATPGEETRKSRGWRGWRRRCCILLSRLLARRAPLCRPLCCQNRAPAE